MTTATCRQATNCRETDRAQRRPREGERRPRDHCGFAVDAEANPQHRIQRGPGWAAADSIALSAFR